MRILARSRLEANNETESKLKKAKLWRRQKKRRKRRPLDSRAKRVNVRCRVLHERA
jgi:hypothetical protein